MRVKARIRQKNRTGPIDGIGQAAYASCVARRNGFCALVLLSFLLAAPVAGVMTGCASLGAIGAQTGAATQYAATVAAFVQVDAVVVKAIDELREPTDLQIVTSASAVAALARASTNLTASANATRKDDTEGAKMHALSALDDMEKALSLSLLLGARETLAAQRAIDSARAAWGSP